MIKTIEELGVVAKNGREHFFSFDVKLELGGDGMTVKEYPGKVKLVFGWWRDSAGAMVFVHGGRSDLSYVSMEREIELDKLSDYVADQIKEKCDDVAADVTAKEIEDYYYDPPSDDDVGGCEGVRRGGVLMSCHPDERWA